MGVIHILSDPLLGMKNLNRYLKNGHHAFVWLYSLLGRREILDFREALEILGVKRLPWEERIQLAIKARPLFLSARPTFLRKVIKVLEYLDRHKFKEFGRYLFNHFPNRSRGPNPIIDVADRYLHPQDKYYRFAEAVDLFHDAGFDFVCVLEGMSNTLEESFGCQEILRNGRRFSRLDAYKLIELYEKPGGVGYLIKKIREVSE